jgi:hypothetical protein
MGVSLDTVVFHSLVAHIARLTLLHVTCSLFASLVEMKGRNLMLYTHTTISRPTLLVPYARFSAVNIHFTGHFGNIHPSVR